MANGKDFDSSVPVPDPTILTTQALQREVEGLRELIEQRIEGLRDVVGERFHKSNQEFELVERQRVEQKRDTKDAVDAALTAQKEAVREQTAASDRAIAKSEAATSKQLDQLMITFTTAIAAIQREMGEAKERLTTLEQQKVGAKDDRSGLYATMGVVATILAVVISLIVVLTNIAMG